MVLPVGVTAFKKRVESGDPRGELPVEDRYGVLDLSPQEIKRRTLDGIINYLADLSARQPIVFLFEDVHWIDPTSQELLELLVERIRTLPVLLMVTHRPEWQPTFVAQSHIATLKINRLGRRQGGEIVRSIAGDDVLDEILRRIVERTDGVPLFVEEVTKSLVEAGLDMARADIPATLQGSLLARLDRLGPQAKEVAQIGAVIGREFSHKLTAAVFGQPEDNLAQALEHLVRAELLFRSGAPPEATYTFKHALVQDAAYDSLLLTRRRELHSAIVTELERLHADNLGEVVETLAHHARFGELWQEAIRYLNEAGAKAYARSSCLESIAHYETALRALEHLPESREREEQAIDIRLDLRNPYFLLGDIDNGIRLLREVDYPAKAISDDRRRGRALAYMSNQIWMTGETQQALGLAQEALTVGEAIADQWLIVVASYYLGGAAFSAGRRKHR